MVFFIQTSKRNKERTPVINWAYPPIKKSRMFHPASVSSRYISVNPHCAQLIVMNFLFCTSSCLKLIVHKLCTSAFWADIWFFIHKNNPFLLDFSISFLYRKVTIFFECIICIRCYWGWKIIIRRTFILCSKYFII